MCASPLHAGVQVQFLATGSFGQLDEPVQKFLAVAFPSGGGERHQIVNVKKFSTRQMFAEAITGDGGDFAIGFEHDEKIASALKSPDGWQKSFRLEMRTQFTHHGETTENIFVGFRKLNGNGLHEKF